jgi:hypothetical protein
MNGTQVGLPKKRHITGRPYVLRKEVATEDELMLEEALNNRGVLGASWKLIMHGRPSRGHRLDATVKGFRTLEA